MRTKLSAQLNYIVVFLLFLLTLITPLLFMPIFTDFFDTPKVIFIISIALIGMVLWSINWVIQGKVLITKTPLDIPLLLLLLVVILSTFFSSVRSVSIYGNIPVLHGSAATWIAYILIYFLAVSHIKSRLQIKVLFYGLLFSTAIACLVSLLSYFGILISLLNAFHIKPVVNTLAAFTTTGSSYSTTALAALLLPFSLYALVTPTKILPRVLAVLSTIMLMLTIVLVGNMATMVAGTIAVVLVLWLNRKAVLASLPFVLIPLILVGTIGGLTYLPASAGNQNPFAQKQTEFSRFREVQLPFNTSWDVAISTFRVNPALGSGPATYLFDFTKYRPITHNLSPFWNVRFDTAHNEFLQTLPTMGGLGFVALIFFAGAVLLFAWKDLIHPTNEVHNYYSPALAVAAILTVVLLALHVTTPVVMLAIMLILAMLMAMHKSISGKVEELTLGIKAAKYSDSNLIVGDVLPIIILIPLLILAAIIVWKMAPAVKADFHHRNGLTAASENAKATYDNLLEANRLNPNSDLYLRDLAQTNFAIANLIATAKGPSEASPAGSLTEEDKTRIQTLLSQSITAAKLAVNVNPTNASNYEVLANIYRQISGVAQNALAFALDSYGRAINLDPFNPILRLNAGGIYYSVKNYDLAIRLFSDSANLKPNYANAYYNLSIALRDKGSLKEAQQVGEKVIQLIGPDNRDYKPASEYLEDLKNRIATGSAAASEIVPPAAAETGALQQKNLPKVLDLPNKPENIATPAAVQKPAKQ